MEGFLDGGWEEVNFEEEEVVVEERGFVVL